MTLSEFYQVLRRSWALLVAGLLVGVAAGSVATLMTSPQYVASSQVLVSVASAGSVTDLSQGSSFAQQVVKSYASVATSDYVLRPVAAKYRLSSEPLAQAVTATATDDTSIITIQVSQATASRAASIANAVAKQLAAAALAISPTTSSAASPVRITQIQIAQAPSTPVEPRPALNLVVGFLSGALLGVVAAYARSRSDTRLITSLDVERVSGLPVLAETLFLRESDAPIAEAESYKVLRTAIQFARLRREKFSVAVTSALEHEGKSTTVMNLAAAFAQAGRSVVVVDADLRRPALAERFGIDGSTGLTDQLVGTAQLDDVIQATFVKNLFLMPAGTRAPNPSELLQSPAMAALLLELNEKFDIVIFDTPPILPVTDASIIGQVVDGVVVVAAARQSRSQQLARAVVKLQNLRVPIDGVVLNMVRPRDSATFEYSGPRTPFAEGPTVLGIS